MSKIKTSVRRLKVRRLIERDGDECHYCKEPLNNHNRTLDHIVPSSEEGGHSDANLVLACAPCNNVRGSMPYKEFIAIPRQQRFEAALRYNKTVHGPMGQFRGRHWRVRLTHRPFREVTIPLEEN